MLINCVVDMPDVPALMGEIQIHLRDVIIVKEEIHHLYEIIRASTAQALHDEANASSAHRRAAATLSVGSRERVSVRWRVFDPPIIKQVVSMDDAFDRQPSRASDGCTTSIAITASIPTAVSFAASA